MAAGIVHLSSLFKFIFNKMVLYIWVFYFNFLINGPHEKNVDQRADLKSVAKNKALVHIYVLVFQRSIFFSLEILPLCVPTFFNCHPVYTYTDRVRLHDPSEPNYEQMDRRIGFIAAILKPNLFIFYCLI
jgi:hypothetical protein